MATFQVTTSRSGSLPATCSATSIHTPPISSAQGDGLQGFGQLPAGLAHDQPDHRGDQEGHADFEHVIAVVALAQAGGQGSTAAAAAPDR